MRGLDLKEEIINDISEYILKKKFTQNANSTTIYSKPIQIIFYRTQEKFSKMFMQPFFIQCTWLEMDTVKYLKMTKKGHKYTLKVVYTNNALYYKPYEGIQ